MLILSIYKYKHFMLCVNTEQTDRQMDGWVDRALKPAPPSQGS